jgi:O-antigen/teichoic acid export membrane protein
MDRPAGQEPPDSISRVSEQVTGGPVALDRAPASGLVARAVSWKALSVIVGQGFWYASLFVLAILVPPRDFGVIAVGSVVITITTLLLESGTGGALIIAPELDARRVRRAVIRTSAAGIAVTLAFIALASPIAGAFAKGSDPNALRGLAPVVALVAVWIVPNALLMKYLRFKAIAIITVTSAATASIAAVIAVALGAEVWALVIRLVVYQLLLAVLTWAAAASVFPRLRRDDAEPARRTGATAFLGIAIAGFLAWTGDTLIVAGSTNTTQTGLYALAFSLAFAPLTQVSWTIGQVLLPAVASARDPEVVRRQALKSLRLMALLLLPIVPAAIALAPGLIPTLIGDKWSGMVTPFQILIVVGVGQGLVNVLGEVFAGAGGQSLDRRARIDVVWALGTLALIALGVQLWGIRGAAAVHVLSLGFLATAYVSWGGRTIGVTPGGIARELGPVASSVLAQALVTGAVALAARSAGAGTLVAGLVGTGAGALVLASMLWTRARSLLDECRGVLTAAIARRSAPA